MSHPIKLEKNLLGRLFSTTRDITEAAFQTLAEEIIAKISAKLDDALPENGTEIEESAGVLKLGTPNGTFIINRQVPSRQIWLSSPFSGPAHFDVDPLTKKCLDDKTQTTELSHLLQKELQRVYKDKTIVL